jgi:hypothetical protein
MMETVSTSETSVNSYETARHNIPESCHLKKHINSIFSYFNGSLALKLFTFRKLHHSESSSLEDLHIKQLQQQLNTLNN